MGPASLKTLVGAKALQQSTNNCPVASVPSASRRQTATKRGSPARGRQRDGRSHCQLRQYDHRQKSKRPNHQDRKTCLSRTHPQPKCQSRALTPVTHHQPRRIAGSPASRSAPPALAPTGSARYCAGLSTLHPCHPARICRTKTAPLRPAGFVSAVPRVPHPA